MAKFSKKVMGKEVGQASVYAAPHKMSGAKETGQIPKVPYVTEKSARDAGLTDPLPNGVSYAVSGEPKTAGTKMRGAGAATKGVMSRGPMA